MNSDTIKSNKAWIDEVWEKIDNKLSCIALKSRDKIPYTAINGVHDDQSKTNINMWTNGFWGGLMWLMFNATSNEEYKKTAEVSEWLMDEALKNYEELYHDVGFMWHIMSGASYRLTGNKMSKTRNLFAAASLASRYNIDGGYIRAWNGFWDGIDTKGLSIIDCMMNLPLLYWASDEIGDERFKKIAMSHADMTLCDHIRPDGSVNHIVEHCAETGTVIRTYGGQGYAEGSSWSRGCAWAVYGTVLSYIHTNKKEYLDAAVKTANYFIVNSEAANFLTPVDFRSPIEPVYYDASATLCAACGILELSKYVSEAEEKVYTEAAISMLKATVEHFCDFTDKSDMIVQTATERYPNNGNNNGVHIPIIYSDFFLAEALTKLKGVDFLIW